MDLPEARRDNVGQADELEQARKLLRAASLLLEAGAPGPENERVQKDLEEWAHARGYEEDVTFKSGARPDVLRRRGDRHLFVGDAKDAANEDPSTADTLKRFRRYLEEFGAALLTSQIDGGFLAIATNNEAAAGDWRTALDVLAREVGLANKAGPPSFQIELCKEKTWIIWW